MAHRWTTDDAARWRKLATLAARVLSEPAGADGEVRAASLGDLKVAADRAFSAGFPTADVAAWQPLRRFQQRAETFALMPAASRRLWVADLTVQTLAAHRHLGLTPPPGLGAAIGTVAAAPTPYWMRD